MSPNFQINQFFQREKSKWRVSLSNFFFWSKILKKFLLHARESPLGLLNLIMKQVLRKWQKKISSILFNTHILIKLSTTSFFVLNAEVVMHFILMMLSLMSDMDIKNSGAPFKFLWKRVMLRNRHFPSVLRWIRLPRVEWLAGNLF